MAEAMLKDSVETIFANNRAVASVALSAKFAFGASRREHVHEEGALRVRCPGAPAEELEATIVNTAGGMAGGDRFVLDFSAGPNARLLVTSASAERIYRTLGPDTSVDAKLAVAPGGELAWLPRETILFDRARLRRSIEVDLAPDAHLLLAEAVVFGRSGMGESIAEGFLLDRWRIRREGRLVHAETMRLAGNMAAKLDRPAIAGGGMAIASILMVPGDSATADAVRSVSAESMSEIGVSAWNGLLAVRMVAAHGAALRHDLSCIVGALRGGRLPRLWFN
ncbi:MAG TPA: urease accessory protein UreD [Xanthobacteraceae bacterium]|nr:urease accessory protein UreD [Xanthobacteraceae bacterium]